MTWTRTQDKVTDKEKSEMSRIQYLTATDHPVETNKDDGDISLKKISNRHGHQSINEDY